MGICPPWQSISCTGVICLQQATSCIAVEHKAWPHRGCPAALHTCRLPRGNSNLLLLPEEEALPPFLGLWLRLVHQSSPPRAVMTTTKAGRAVCP